MSRTAPYVILGNGAAGISAVRAIRLRDSTSPIILITEEPPVAYSPALLPYLLAGKIKEDTIALTDMAFYERLGVTVLHETRAIAVEPQDQCVALANGDGVRYAKLLVATGANAKGEVVRGAPGGQPLTLRTLVDGRKARGSAARAHHVVVLGAGLAGLEIAMALRQRSKSVTVVARSPQILSRNTGPDEARLVQHLIEQSGVNFLLGRTTEAVEDAGGQAFLTTLEGDTVRADLLIAAKGAEPNDYLLPSRTDTPKNGIAVDAYMRTTFPNVFAAGDVARSPNALTGDLDTLATWPSACFQGAVAGTNMAGGEACMSGEIRHNVLPVFGRPVAFIGLAGIRSSQARSEPYEIVTAGGEKSDRFRRLYFDRGRLIGAFAVGKSRDLGLLRLLIETATPLTAEERRSVVTGSGWGALYGRMLPHLGTGRTRDPLRTAAANREE
jgi:phenylglyoxylate dehydrogenase epsilon subunit